MLALEFVTIYQIWPTFKDNSVLGVFSQTSRYLVTVRDILSASKGRAMETNEFKTLMRLMLPMMGTQLCIMGMGFIDTAMSGHYGSCLLYTSPSPRD